MAKFKTEQARLGRLGSTTILLKWRMGKRVARMNLELVENYFKSIGVHRPKSDAVFVKQGRIRAQRLRLATRKL
jgi:hypothetical protein